MNYVQSIRITPYEGSYLLDVIVPLLYAVRTVAHICVSHLLSMSTCLCFTFPLCVYMFVFHISSLCLHVCVSHLLSMSTCLCFTFPLYVYMFVQLIKTTVYRCDDGLGFRIARFKISDAASSDSSVHEVCYLMVIKIKVSIVEN